MIHRLLVEPYHLAFMRRALTEVLLLGIAGGVIGVHVVLRRRAFLTEALQHTVFPGIAIAFVAGASLLLGAVAAALLTIVLLAGLRRRPRVDPDAAMALLLASFFAVGVVVVSRRTGYTSDLNALLFGRILDVDRGQLVATALVGAALLALLTAVHKELVLGAFDPIQTEAAGYPARALDLLVDVAVALLVVVAVRAVGTVLVVAFVVTPATTARLLTRTVGPMMVVSCLLAAGLGYLGLSISYEASVHHDLRLAAGATVVVTYTAGFVVFGGGAALARRMLSRVP